MEFRERPMSNYLQKASWDELYVLSKHWESDMDFYRDELRFLSDLLDRYFVWLVSEEHISEVREIGTRLGGVSKELDKVKANIRIHLKHIQSAIEETKVVEDFDFRKEHADLEDAIVHLIKSFRILKREIFSTTERVVEEEKLQRLLKP